MSHVQLKNNEDYITPVHIIMPRGRRYATVNLSYLLFPTYLLRISYISCRMVR